MQKKMAEKIIDENKRLYKARTQKLGQKLYARRTAAASSLINRNNPASLTLLPYETLLLSSQRSQTI
jgi:hypothetical protein